MAPAQSGAVTGLLLANPTVSGPRVRSRPVSLLGGLRAGSGRCCSVRFDAGACDVSIGTLGRSPIGVRENLRLLFLIDSGTCRRARHSAPLDDRSVRRLDTRWGWVQPGAGQSMARTADVHRRVRESGRCGRSGRRARSRCCGRGQTGAGRRRRILDADCHRGTSARSQTAPSSAGQPVRLQRRERAGRGSSHRRFGRGSLRRVRNIDI